MKQTERVYANVPPDQKELVPDKRRIKILRSTIYRNRIIRTSSAPSLASNPQQPFITLPNFAVQVVIGDKLPSVSPKLFSKPGSYNVLPET